MKVRYLGGESGHRGVFGRTNNRTRFRVLLIIGVVAGVLSVSGLTVLAVLVAVIGLPLGAFATMKTSRETPFERWRLARLRRARTKTGQTVFRPVGQRPESLAAEVFSGTKAERRAAKLEWVSYRDWPDGAEGMYWLAERPGVAWHKPTGEEEYLSVVFPVQGQIAGLQGAGVIDAASDKFGHFLAGLGGELALLRRVQMVTRVQPVDTAAHEAWVVENLAADGDRSDLLTRSYAQVVDQLGHGGLGQRHYACLRWPITGDFLAEAGRRGRGRAGWLALMADEVDAGWRALVAAGLGPGPAMSARQVAAVLRNAQLPSWPVDQAGDVDPASPWVTTEEVGHSYVECTGRGPEGEWESWLHATAVVTAENLDTTPRTPTWMLPLTTRMAERVVRTVSMQYEGVPRAEALRRAKEDVTADKADRTKRRRSGREDDEEQASAQAASEARRADLGPGQGHAGGGWTMHISVSAESLVELRRARRLLEAQAGAAGITRLRWIDALPGVASASTWPIARGMKPVSAKQRLLVNLATGSGDDL